MNSSHFAIGLVVIGLGMMLLGFAMTHPGFARHDVWVAKHACEAISGHYDWSSGECWLYRAAP